MLSFVFWEQILSLSLSLSLSLPPLSPPRSLSHKELLSLYLLLIGTIIQTVPKSLFSATWHFSPQLYNIHLWQYIFNWWISSWGCQHKHREKEAVILFKRWEVSHIIPKAGSSLSGHAVPGTPSLAGCSAQCIHQGGPMQLFTGSLNGADLSQEWQPGQLFALWEQVQAGSNETHPNTNSEILNHVSKKDVPVSSIQWSQSASYTFEDEVLSGFSIECSKESIVSLSFLMHISCLLDEISNSDTPHAKKHVFE